MMTMLRCRTIASGATQHLNYIRDLQPIAVEERLGPPGASSVATPSETLLAAIGSCLGARVQANAASAGIAVHGLELDVEADLAASTMWGPHGSDPAPVGFDTVRVAVRLDADAAPEALRAIVAHALLWSPVANTIHNIVHLDVEWVDQTTSLT